MHRMRENFLTRNVRRLKAAFGRSGISYQELSERMGGSPSASTLYRVFSGECEPRWSTLAAIAGALGVRPVEQPPPERVPVGDFALPVVAEGRAKPGGADATVRPVRGAGRLGVSFRGLVACRVRGDALLPLAADGEHVLCDPRLHPDRARPHPLLAAPVALVRLRGGRLIIRRWHHDRRTGRVTLRTVNESHKDARGQILAEEVDFREILEACTVVGVRW